jgi:hypothetical protein
MVSGGPLHLLRHAKLLSMEADRKAQLAGEARPRPTATCPAHRGATAGVFLY